MDSSQPIFKAHDLAVYPDRVQSGTRTYPVQAISAIETSPPGGWFFFIFTLVLTAAAFAVPICLPVTLIMNVIAFTTRNRYQVVVTIDGLNHTVLKTRNEATAQEAEAAIVSALGREATG